MSNPLLSNSVQKFRFAVVATLFAVLHLVSSMLYFGGFSYLLLVHSAALSISYALLSILIWVIIDEGNFTALSSLQRLTNLSALLILFVGISSVGTYGVTILLFSSSKANLLLPMLGFELMIGSLIFLLLIHYFNEISSAVDSLQESLLLEDSSIETSSNTPVELIERISVKAGSKVHVIETEQLICLISDGDYVQLITTDGKFLKEKTMKYFEEHLSSEEFVRIHRTCIVNIRMISSIEQYQKQTQLVTLKNGIKVKASPTGYKALRKALNL